MRNHTQLSCTRTYQPPAFNQHTIETRKESKENQPDNSKGTPEPTNQEHTTLNNTPTKATKDTVQIDSRNEEDETEEFFMDKIIGHHTNKSKKHQYASVGELLYRIRWYNYGPSNNTWELISQIPQSKVLLCHKRKIVPLPENLDDAIDG